MIKTTTIEMTMTTAAAITRSFVVVTPAPNINAADAVVMAYGPFHDMLRQEHNATWMPNLQV
jgi:hypothetical protein